MKKPLLMSLNGVEKSWTDPFGRRRKVLDGLSLELRTGEAAGLFGASGTGKSTLARIILGLDSPDKGEVLFAGQPVPYKNQKKRRAHFRSVQIVWQDPYIYLNPFQSVFETIREPLAAFDICPKQDRAERVENLMDQMGLPVFLAKRRPHQLSGGQCQRVAIARALAVSPKILICDEALVSLDLPQQVSILKRLKDLKAESGLSILFISHNIDTIRALCDFSFCLEEGRLTGMKSYVPKENCRQAETGGEKICNNAS